MLESINQDECDHTYSVSLSYDALYEEFGPYNPLDPMDHVRDLEFNFCPNCGKDLRKET